MEKMDVWADEADFGKWKDSEGGRRVVLGVDGGGTSTMAAVMGVEVDAGLLLVAEGGCGPLLGEGLGGSTNANSVGTEAAALGLEEAIAAALRAAKVPRQAVQRICLGMSGVDSLADIERVRGWVRSIFPDESVGVSIHNDSVAALASGTGGRLYGCVLIAGTGTIAYGVGRDGTVARAAGAGPALGDRGSGHAIASDALAAVMRASDGRGPATSLTDAILGKLGLSKAEDLIRWAYADRSWARVAALVPEVTACAEKGDAVACQIITDAAHELARSVIAVARRLKLGGEGGAEAFPVVLVGGVLTGSPVVADPLKRNLAAALPSATMTEPKVEPAVGAAMLAWSDYQTMKANAET